MKQMKFFVLFAISLFMMGCFEKTSLTIVNSLYSEEGNRVFVLSDGGIVECCASTSELKYRKSPYSSTTIVYPLDDEWRYAQKGDTVTYSKPRISCKVDSIPEIYVARTFTLDDEYVILLSNGDKTILTKDSYGEKLVFFNNEAGFRKIRTYSSVSWEQWSKVTVGQKVIRFKKAGDAFYKPVALPDYVKERIVKSVSKYDGGLNKVDGKLRMQAHLLSGSSGTGSIHGESIDCEDFFINIYFEDGKPISVNAKDNLFWLDVEKGDTVIEERLNGRIFHSLKF